MVVASSSEDHHLPATLIGNFGRCPPSGSQRSRDRLVAVRYKARPAKIRTVAARYVAKRRDEYRIRKPGTGIDPTFVDQAWAEYEPRLSAAVAALEHGALAEGQWQVLSWHLVAMGVRHPTFRRDVEDFWQQRGVATVDADQVQVERVRTMRETPRMLAASRIAAVRRPTDGRRFVINDKGFSVTGTTGTRVIVFPLSGDVALLCVNGIGLLPGRDHPWLVRDDLVFTPAAVEIVNHVAWGQEGISCVIGHPLEAQCLLALDDHMDLVEPRLGWFRESRVRGLFDWAFE